MPKESTVFVKIAYSYFFRLFVWLIFWLFFLFPYSFLMIQKWLISVAFPQSFKKQSTLSLKNVNSLFSKGKNYTQDHIMTNILTVIKEQRAVLVKNNPQNFWIKKVFGCFLALPPSSYFKSWDRRGLSAYLLYCTSYILPYFPDKEHHRKDWSPAEILKLSYQLLV